VLLVLAALLVGAALRFADPRGVPPALNQDEAVSGYDAYSLLHTGRDHLGHPFPFAGLESFGDWVSPLLTFLTVPAVGLFGLRVEALRAVSAAVGLLAVPAVYLLALELFGRRSIGVVAAWLVAVSPWHVHLSRWAIPPAVVPTMVALTLLALVRAVNRGTGRGIVAAAVVAGLAVASYPTMKLYVPLLGLAALAIYGRAILRVGREALNYAAIVLLVMTGPALYLSLADPGARVRFDEVSVFNAPGAGPRLLARQYAAYFSPRFLFAAGDGDPMHAPPRYGVELRALAPFFLAGLAWLLWHVVRPAAAARAARGTSWAARPHRRSALFLLAAVALYPVHGSLNVPGPHALRAAQLIPLAALVAAAGVVAVADLALRLLGERPQPIRRAALAALAVVVAAAVGLECLGRYEDYFGDYGAQVAPQFQYGLEQALGYARDQQAGYDEIWLADSTAGYIYVLFYAAWPPSDVHQRLEVRRAPGRFNRVGAFDKYRFGEPDGVGRGDLPILYSVRAPGGRTAYVVRGGAAQGHGRILLIYRP